MYGVDESCSQSLPGCLGKLYRCRYESEEFWLKKSVSEFFWEDLWLKVYLL